MTSVFDELGDVGRGAPVAPVPQMAATGSDGGGGLDLSFFVTLGATLGTLADPVAPSIHEQLDMVWQSAGWGSGSPSFDQEDWAGYLDERTYAPLIFGA